MAHPNARCPLSLPFYTYANIRAMSRHVDVVAGYREAAPPPPPAQAVHVLPYVPSTNLAQQGFLRIVCVACRGTVTLYAMTYDGDRRGPVTLSIDSFDGNEVIHLNSTDLENGNPGKGLHGGVGTTRAGWWLELSTSLPIQVGAYIRTPDGFLTSMHDTVPRDQRTHERYPYIYEVPFFNPARNRNQVSVLRIVNPNDSYVGINIDMRDDSGTPRGTHGQGVESRGALMMDATGLEREIGLGVGKWRLTVYAERPVLVMSLLRSPTGHLSNLSTFMRTP